MRKFILLIIILLFSNSFSQNTIFWKITKSGSPNTSYLLGTYHQMGNSYVDSLKIITRSLSSSKVAIFENIDTGKGIAKYLNSRKDDPTYKKKINKVHLEYLERLSQKWTVPLAKLTPSELLLKIQQIYFETQCGNVKDKDTIDNFDNYLIKIAQRDSVALYGLESDSQIISYLNQWRGENWDVLKKEIHQWLDDIKFNRNTDVNCMFAFAYKKQILDYQLDSDCEESVLISFRNANWTPLIEDKISKENCFIAVGLFHLMGKCGLISELRQHGYFVEPLYNLDK